MGMTAAITGLADAFGAAAGAGVADAALATVVTGAGLGAADLAATAAAPAITDAALGSIVTGADAGLGLGGVAASDAANAALVTGAGLGAGDAPGFATSAGLASELGGSYAPGLTSGASALSGASSLSPLAAGSNPATASLAVQPGLSAPAISSGAPGAVTPASAAATAAPSGVPVQGLSGDVTQAAGTPGVNTLEQGIEDAAQPGYGGNLSGPGGIPKLGSPPGPPNPSNPFTDPGINIEQFTKPPTSGWADASGVASSPLRVASANPDVSETLLNGVPQADIGPGGVAQPTVSQSLAPTSNAMDLSVPRDPLSFSAKQIDSLPYQYYLEPTHINIGDAGVGAQFAGPGVPQASPLIESSPGTSGYVDPAYGSFVPPPGGVAPPDAATFAADLAPAPQLSQLSGAGILDPGAGQPIGSGIFAAGPNPSQFATDFAPSPTGTATAALDSVQPADLSGMDLVTPNNIRLANNLAEFSDPFTADFAASPAGTLAGGIPANVSTGLEGASQPAVASASPFGVTSADAGIPPAVPASPGDAAIEAQSAGGGIPDYSIANAGQGYGSSDLTFTPHAATPADVPLPRLSPFDTPLASGGGDISALPGAPGGGPVYTAEPGSVAASGGITPAVPAVPASGVLPVANPVAPTPAAPAVGGLGGIFGGALSNPATLLAGGGLVADVLRGNSNPQGYAQIQSQADAAAKQAQQLQGYLGSGTLPPGLQTSLDTARANAEASVRSRYAQMGMSGSSAEAQDIQNLHNRIVSQGADMAMQLFQQGVSETAISAQLYEVLMNEQIAQDNALSAGITNMVTALAGMGKPLAKAA